MKSLYEIRKKGNKTSVILNPKVFKEIQFHDVKEVGKFYLTVAIDMRKTRDYLGRSDLTFMLEEAGLVKSYRANVEFIFAVYKKGWLLLQIWIPMELSEYEVEKLVEK